MKNNELNSLNRTYAPSLVNYFSDGRGRDTYINYNNGGFLNKGARIYKGLNKFEKNGDVLPATTNFKSLNKNIAPFRYYSDGSGRDKYIIHESGGLEKEFKSLNQYHLKDFLRVYPCNSSKGKFFNQTKTRDKQNFYLSKAEFKVNELKSKLQKDIIKRLYTDEKHKFINLK